MWPREGDSKMAMHKTGKGMESKAGKLKIHGGFKSDGAAVKSGPKKK